MLRVGITGGIGSGKSTVCRIFESLGVPVYYADAEAKRLYSDSPELKAALLEAYGSQILTDGKVNKEFLRRVAFGSEEDSERLNTLVHPFVFEHYENWCSAHDSYAYTIKEAAILFESGSYKRLHKAIGILAPEELRIRRVMNRDHCSREDVLLRMQKQWPQEKLAAACDFLIYNSETDSLIEQVRHIHARLLKDSEQEWPYKA